jgi:hypothetical protein
VPDWGRLVASVAEPDLEAWGRREVGQGIGAHHRGEWVMARRKSLRSQLYRAARDMGNIQAARGGRTSYGKRVVRRKVYRTTNGINRRVLKDLGL